MVQGRMGGHHVHVQGWIQQYFQHNLLHRYRGLWRFLHGQLVLCGHVGTILVNRRYPKSAGKSQEEGRPPCQVLGTYIHSFQGVVLGVCTEKHTSLVLPCPVDAIFSDETLREHGTL